MSRVTVRAATSFLVLSTILAGCATAEESLGDSTQDVTGGEATVETPTIYLFEAKGTRPKCAGVLLGPKVALTAKACASVGLTVVRPGSGGGQARVTEIHVPDGATADIAVVELDRTVGGTHAVITHAPLRDGYSINSTDTVKDPNSTARASVASILGQTVSETDAHTSIVAKTGSSLCRNDLGAPVCSSITATAFGGGTIKTCGLAGIVIAPPEGATPAADPAKPTGTEVTPPGEAAATDSCPTGAWQVAQAGRQAEFIRRFAPEAFEPIKVDSLFGSKTVTPEGLWGFKSNGVVKACKIETATLADVAVKADSKVTAKVSFTTMQERAAAWGRFGIAPKSAPTAVRWLPAKALKEGKGVAFETTFEGEVGSETDGDFIVSFRASANGGETWTQCDTDGIENGFSVEKALTLKVGTGTTTTTPATTPASPTTPSEQTDPSTSSSSDDESSPATSSSEDETTPTEEKKSKKKDEGGCSAAPQGRSTTSSFALFGLLGLAALLGRRRRR